MQWTRAIRIIIGFSTFLVAVTLFGIGFSTATEIGPDQLLLKQSDLPANAHAQIQSSLVPGSRENGMINRDGTDIVQGYAAGARADFIIPLVQVESKFGDQSMTQIYLMNLVYRFADEHAAANELQRLKDLFADYIVADPAAKAQAANSQSVVFERADSENPVATMRWLFKQRGKFLIVLGMPGPLQNSASTLSASSSQSLSQQSVDKFNHAIGELFNATEAVVQSR